MEDGQLNNNPKHVFDNSGQVNGNKIEKKIVSLHFQMILGKILLQCDYVYISIDRYLA